MPRPKKQTQFAKNEKRYVCPKMLSFEQEIMRFTYQKATVFTI